MCGYSEGGGGLPGEQVGGHFAPPSPRVKPVCRRGPAKSAGNFPRQLAKYNVLFLFDIKVLLTHWQQLCVGYHHGFFEYGGFSYTSVL